MNQENMSEAKTILEFMVFTEKLKNELRHCWLSQGRQESVADHCWQMSILALLVFPLLTSKVDQLKTLKMIIIHDLAESITGDVPATEKGPRNDNKTKNEHKAMSVLKSKLNSKIGCEISSLWYEFEANESEEAKFVHALDKLEAQIQHNLSDISTWLPEEYKLVYTKMAQYCQYDSFLRRLSALVQAEAEEKMIAHGVDINQIKNEIIYD